ncbi:uncharacterized protein LOC134191352 [Corticium candelabrum]|uniref:uncharacterized protein LOC134191352 n=1 Tax=Corticium candelabrum TaxID=121492 RepID=UPI002E25D944|nr:uncharacterized protein LOC134191352 [Corticium candelabrum]
MRKLCWCCRSDEQNNDDQEPDTLTTESERKTTKGFLRHCGITDQEIVKEFEKAGYDDATFFVNMTYEDIRTVDESITRKDIERLHSKISANQMDPELAVRILATDNVHDFLKELNLKEEHFQTLKDKIHDLDNLNEDTLNDCLKNKRGYIKKIMFAMAKRRNFTQEEKILSDAMRLLQELDFESLEDGELAFWNKCKEEYLTPEISEHQTPRATKLKESLAELRNGMVLLFLVANVLWILLIETLANLADLQVFYTNALGLMFLVIYGSIVTIQFTTILCHRLITFVHYISRIRWAFRKPSCCCSCCCKKNDERGNPKDEEEEF